MEQSTQNLFDGLGYTLCLAKSTVLVILNKKAPVSSATPKEKNMWMMNCRWFDREDSLQDAKYWWASKSGGPEYILQNNLKIAFIILEQYFMDRGNKDYFGRE